MLMQGAERKPMLANLMFMLFCVFILRSVPIAIFGIIMFFVIRAVLRRLCSAVDPSATMILARHMKYKKAYDGHSTAWGMGKPQKRWM